MLACPHYFRFLSIHILSSFFFLFLRCFGSSCLFSLTSPIFFVLHYFVLITSVLLGFSLFFSFLFLACLRFLKFLLHSSLFFSFLFLSCHLCASLFFLLCFGLSFPTFFVLLCSFLSCHLCSSLFFFVRLVFGLVFVFICSSRFLSYLVTAVLL